MGIMPPDPGMPMPGPAGMPPAGDPLAGSMPGPVGFPTTDPGFWGQLLAPMEQDKAMLADAQMQALMQALAPLMANQPNPEAAAAGVEPGPMGPPPVEQAPAEPMLPY